MISRIFWNYFGNYIEQNKKIWKIKIENFRPSLYFCGFQSVFTRKSTKKCWKMRYWTSKSSTVRPRTSPYKSRILIDQRWFTSKVTACEGGARADCCRVGQAWNGVACEACAAGTYGVAAPSGPQRRNSYRSRSEICKDMFSAISSSFWTSNSLFSIFSLFSIWWEHS